MIGHTFNNEWEISKIAIFKRQWYNVVCQIEICNKKLDHHYLSRKLHIYIGYL